MRIVLAAAACAAVLIGTLNAQGHAPAQITPVQHVAPVSHPASERK